MSSYRPRLVPDIAVGLVAALAAALLVAGPVPAALAAGTPTVGGLTAAGQDWPNARLKVRWTRVSGATYQVRWATSTARLTTAKIQSVKTNAATSPVLSTRCVPWYAQVRAVLRGKVGSWSRAKALRFSRGAPAVPGTSTTTQASETSAQVRIAAASYVARKRLDWSAAPFGFWSESEQHVYTPWLGAATGVASAKLPATAAPKDRFIAPAYGNPVFARVQYDNGCMTTPHRTTYFPVFPKSPATGAGDLVAIGSYNLEGTPTNDEGNGTKLANIADNLVTNVGSRELDIIALQESSEETAADLVDRLPGGAAAWDSHGAGAQQILWRTAVWQAVDGSATDVGETHEGDPATPLPTPGIRLTPAVPEPGRQDVYVVSVHLEDAGEANATVKQRKAAAHSAASILLDNIAEENQDDVPTLVAGDLKGNFTTATTSGYCDENNGCQPEGQPTFVRAGFWDARTAPTRIGLAYGTVNKHDPDQPRAASGVGTRADFILARGAGGFTLQGTVVHPYGNASAAQQPDHNLVFARLYVPRLTEEPETP